ncbi:MAG: CBS domain-containing protein [Myxococcales bacterium]|nr:CBS domain-containing protein [Myxococcales bacterium]
MLMPPISRFMTAKPVTVGRAATLADAHRLMREHAIRHLPVVDDKGELCGVVSERDLHLIETLTEASPEDAQVEDAMVEHPFVVTGDTALDEVAEIMGEHKYGSVVVMGRDGVEGIFTAVDACQVLAQLVRRAVA